MKSLSSAIAVIALSMGLQTGAYAEQSLSVAMTTSLGDFFQDAGVKVTTATYPLHETARQFLKTQTAVGVNAIAHRRELTPTDKQPVVRMNRDTYYSMAVVDVSGGASITLPDVPEGKYVSVQPVTEDHRIQPMSYGGGSYELATHYGDHLYLVIRLDATFSAQDAARYQDQMQIHAASATPFAAVPVDPRSFEETESALKAQMPRLLARDDGQATLGMFTAPTDDSRAFFDQQKYEVGAAIGWGGAQWKDC